MPLLDADSATRDSATRHLLLPALHAAQARVGWISEGALNHICERLSVPPAEAYGVASFYAMFSMKPRPPSVVHVCDDIACRVNGAEALCRDLEQQIGKAGEPSAGRTHDVGAQPVSRPVRARAGRARSDAGAGRPIDADRRDR